MGDMADYVNEQMEEEVERRFDYRMGRMSPCEAYDQGIIDEHGAEYGTRKSVTCKHCGERFLFWMKTADGWRTADSSGIHICPTFNKSVPN